MRDFRKIKAWQRGRRFRYRDEVIEIGKMTWTYRARVLEDDE